MIVVIINISVISVWEAHYVHFHWLTQSLCVFIRFAGRGLHKQTAQTLTVNCASSPRSLLFIVNSTVLCCLGWMHSTFLILKPVCWLNICSVMMIQLETCLVLQQVHSQSQNFITRTKDRQNFHSHRKVLYKQPRYLVSAFSSIFVFIDGWLSDHLNAVCIVTRWKPLVS